MKKVVSALLTAVLLVAMLPGAFALDSQGLVKIYVNDRDVSHGRIAVDTITQRTVELEAYNVDGSLANVIWVSGNTQLATVDGNGNVAVNTTSEGEVDIYCYAADGPDKSCRVTLQLYKKVHRLSLFHYTNFNMRSESIVSLSPKYFNPLGAEYKPSNPQLVWEVVQGKDFAYFSNTAAGTLCTSKVTKAELVKVRVSSADNSKAWAEMWIKVIPVLEKISMYRLGQDVTGQELSGSVGIPVVLTAVETPSQSADLIWSSSLSYVTVADGMVTAAAPGTVVITAAAADGSGKSACVTIKFS